MTDRVDSTPTTRIVSVESNEPSDGDWEVTGDLTLMLRAERSGHGPGRVYTISVESRDDSGNATIQTVTVAVPKRPPAGHQPG